ncbi:MAG: glycosyltransferase, partial [Nitrososphaera sp.]|nr:glycosyltransferase [Nitrososphaera sp.]
MTPRVSVVIPAYNCAQHIAETLQSVLDQDYPNLEIIVVDDGSIDNTRDVVTQFHSERITYLYQSNSGGPSRPRNVGIARAQGQYVALFDSDDVMLPGKIRAAAEFLTRESHLGLVFTNFVKYDEIKGLYPGTVLDNYDYFRNVAKRQVSDRQYIIKGELAYEALISENYIGTSSVVIPKEVFSRVGTFDESVSGPEDFDMWLRVTSAYDIGFIDMIGHRY